MPSKTFRAVAAGVVLIGVVVAAVIQIQSKDAPPTELAEPVPTTEPPEAPSRATEATEPDFVYRVGLLAGVTTTNYWEYIGAEPTAWNAYVLGPTKPALYSIDPAANTLVPELAAGEADPTWDDEGWRVRIRLSDDLAWSDGVPVTANDVVYTFETVRRLDLGGGWADAYPDGIEEMVAESETELRIEFAARPGLGLWPYGLGLAPIMPAHVWAEQSEAVGSAAELYAFDDSDVSGGPLQIVTVRADRIEAVANPGYPGNSADGVVYMIFSDEDEAVSAVKTGAIDTILDPNGLSAGGASTLAGLDGVAIERSPANSVRYLGFNLTRDPMSRPEFRRSLALLLDRGAATETLAQEADTAYTMLSSANASWFDEEQAVAISSPYTRSLEDRVAEAVSGLQGAGYVWESPPTVVDGALTPGTGLTIEGRPPAPLTILTPGDEYDPARPDYTSRIEATLETLGFDVRPVVTDFDTVVDLAFSEDSAGARQYDMYVLGWTLGNPVLPDYHRWLFATGAAANSTGYSAPDFDADLALYQEATAPEAAREALWGMEQAVARDLPYLVLYHPEIVEAYRSDRVGFGEHGVLGGIQGRLGGLEDLSPQS
ncbi:MAG TPA: ABC transporter substrate-binding protein [Acidimicrobiia bacterium]|nr:ABC transporter substrate-binding protein [Acidimicrobiia bacterium]